MGDKRPGLSQRKKIHDKYESLKAKNQAFNTETHFTDRQKHK